MDMKVVCILLVSVIGLFQGYCQADEVFADLDYELKHDPEKTLRELKSATPMKVAQLLASSKADVNDLIGKYPKWDYLNLIDLEPKYCLKEEIEKREALCRATELVGLKDYCNYCVDHLRDYCERTQARRILDSFIEIKDKDSVIEQALKISSEIDEFIESKGDQNAADKTNVLDFCKSIKWTSQRKPSVYQCSHFSALITDLAQYEPDQEELFQYLKRRTNSDGFDKVASRCRIIVESCHNPLSSMI